jgi:hypothetical protein
MSFPLSPTNGQTAVLNGITYSYSSANALWTRVTGTVPNTIKSTSSANSPASPNIGDIWYNTVTDDIYRYTSDGVTSYWLDITGASTTVTTGAASALVVSQPTYAVNFASTYLSISYIAGLELATTSVFTIEAWVNLTANTAGQSTIIGTRNNGAAGWEFRLSATRTIQFYYTGGSALNTTDTLNLGVWYHVAFVRNSGTVYIFINGALSTTATGFANGTAVSNPIVVGNQTGVATTYFNGSISNLRVLNGTALYTAAFAVPSIPLSAIANTQLLTCQNVPVADASTNTNQVTNVGGASLAIYAAPAVSYASQTLYYRLESALVGANVATAQSVFGVGVTLVGSTVYQFRIVIGLYKTVGGGTHTIGFGFGGSATINNIGYAFTANETTGQFPTLAAVQSASMVLTTSNTTITATTSVASKSYSILIDGTVSVNAGGTFIPQYTLSVAPGGTYTTAAGSYITFTPIGRSGANSSLGTWA